MPSITNRRGFDRLSAIVVSGCDAARQEALRNDPWAPRGNLTTFPTGMADNRSNFLGRGPCQPWRLSCSRSALFDQLRVPPAYPKTHCNPSTAPAQDAAGWLHPSARMVLSMIHLWSLGWGSTAIAKMRNPRQRGRHALRGHIGYKIKEADKRVRAALDAQVGVAISPHDASLLFPLDLSRAPCYRLNMRGLVLIAGPIPCTRVSG